ncbi:aminopeptidase [Pullulanibacillus sp. KACC 23026]|uniref:aminopeptidase n=1 Tax=Pullulanibacillus sp. KACC 23026 TaxID=3028315 RepID=UPI0023B097D7|nr:aminopeptidase [Pullulanibacillus sp. KACC 23026]WEG13152.1 aminopeptidase [Pullulanibacillus sp. KACC 23026]
MENFEVLLERYADLAVKIGVNLQEKQILHISAPTHAAEFVRFVVRKAYEVGALDVIIDWSDEGVIRARYDLAPDESFKSFPDWEVQKLETLVEKGAAFMTVFSQNPDLLTGVDPTRLATWQKTAAEATHSYRNAIMGGKVSRTVVSTPTPEWAKKVFPALSEEEAVEKLWKTIFEVTRVSTPDPIQSWKEHRARLTERLEYLNAQQFKALKYTGEGTDLTLELPERHVWIGGGMETAQGIYCHPNIPTEEVFTAPKKDGVNGVVRSTKPLNYRGSVINDFVITFENGRIVKASAETGEETLENLIETDEGSHYLGEVALVPHQSPISQSGLIFYNTLFDENASCHLAIGTAYSFNIEGGTTMSKEELEAHHINSSLTHVDFMVGSESLNIDAQTQEGEWIPLFRNGNWAG